MNKYLKQLRKFARAVLMKKLAILGRLIVRKYKPLVIGVTGSVGKTSTKEAIYTALRTTKNIRRSRGNFNTEFGFPLAIISDYAEVGGWLFWMGVVFRGFFQFILPDFIARIFFGEYPQILALEYAADKPGDIRYLLKIARPNIAVVTAIGDVPVHVEFYKDPDEVVKEKAGLVDELSGTAHVILNADEEKVLKMRDQTKAIVSTFGFDEKADARIINFETKLESAGKGTVKKPVGIRFEIQSGDEKVPINIGATLGKSQAYSVAAASAVALRLGLNLTQIADAFTYFQVPGQRVRLFSGKGDTSILDDSYNSSPVAAKLAIETIAEIKAKRKIAVLGDMLELGTFSDRAHSSIGRLASRVFDILITVGDKAKHIASAAKKEGMKESNVFHFKTADEVEEYLLKEMKKGDFILIKGSKNIGLKKVAEALRLGKLVE
ncbi:MAG: UDP-N-acetylmuramoyl-tripeptide--D-alanyl-D-alanine ligase [bacterium]|nr:UDP-N-acetylmuramoyl-tripeptide--D-alanyl-D-alanine ligase [bacterium]